MRSPVSLFRAPSRWPRIAPSAVEATLPPRAAAVVRFPWPGEPPTVARAARHIVARAASPAVARAAAGKAAPGLTPSGIYAGSIPALCRWGCGGLLDSRMAFALPLQHPYQRTGYLRSVVLCEQWLDCPHLSQPVTALEQLPDVAPQQLIGPARTRVRLAALQRHCTSSGESPQSAQLSCLEQRNDPRWFCATHDLERLGIHWQIVQNHCVRVWRDFKATDADYVVRPTVPQLPDRGAGFDF